MNNLLGGIGSQRYQGHFAHVAGTRAADKRQPSSWA